VRSELSQHVLERGQTLGGVRALQIRLLPHLSLVPVTMDCAISRHAEDITSALICGQAWHHVLRYAIGCKSAE
jgi:hypothetical protein